MNITDFLPITQHEYQQLIFLGQFFAGIAVVAVIGAILRPEEW